jgi:hypothetical protein
MGEDTEGDDAQLWPSKSKVAFAVMAQRIGFSPSHPAAAEKLHPLVAASATAHQNRDFTVIALA